MFIPVISSSSDNLLFSIARIFRVAIVDTAFSKFDSNNDGLITFEEAQGEMLQRGLSQEQVITVFKTYDSDGDGRLNRQEFGVFWNVPIF